MPEGSFHPLTEHSFNAGRNALRLPSTYLTNPVISERPYLSAVHSCINTLCNRITTYPTDKPYKSLSQPLFNRTRIVHRPYGSRQTDHASSDKLSFGRLCLEFMSEGDVCIILLHELYLRSYVHCTGAVLCNMTWIGLLVFMDGLRLSVCNSCAPIEAWASITLF